MSTWTGSEKLLVSLRPKSLGKGCYFQSPEEVFLFAYDFINNSRSRSSFILFYYLYCWKCYSYPSYFSPLTPSTPHLPPEAFTTVLSVSKCSFKEESIFIILTLSELFPQWIITFNLSHLGYGNIAFLEISRKWKWILSLHICKKYAHSIISIGFIEGH